MAFIPGSISKQYLEKTPVSGGFVPGSVAKKYLDKAPTGGGFVPGSIAKTLTIPSIKTKDLSSKEGLYNLAIQNGLQKEADSILARQSGEETKKIFSGGFISDIFDVVNAAQFGVVGILKGKSFSEGVRTRQSFSDKDSLGANGIPGVIAGIILDIAVDPLTYISPVTIFKKIPGAIKGLEAAKALTFGKKVTKVIEGTEKTFETLEGGTKLGKYLGQKFAWMFGADPIFKETFERSLKNTAIETENIVKLSKGVAKIKPETAAKILSRDPTGRFIRTPLEILKNTLSPEELADVTALYSKIDDLGQQAVDLGLLSKGKFEENMGEYLKNAYLYYEEMAKKGLFGIKKVGIKGIKKRVEGLTPEKMAELGQIDNPAYLLFKSAFDLQKDVENAKLLRTTTKLFGSDVAQEGFSKIAAGTKWGNLANKYVPDNVAMYLNEIIEPAKDTLAKNMVANFKFFKVIMNPATHARNVVSNQILNYWKLGMNPLDPRVIKSNAIALKEIFKGAGKWSDEARPLGYSLDTFASAEMKGLLNSTEANMWGKGVSGWKKIKESLGKLYQAEENTAKLSAYIFNRTTKAMDAETAWKAAEAATFNYAQVTPFVRKLRESLFGFPFITFTVKSTPIVLETLVKAPHRIGSLGKIKQGIENLSDLKETDRERASEPPWVKNGFYIKLPMKDKEGRSAYFDLTYILPFGDLVSGNFFERPIRRETGLPESLPVSIAKKSPFINLITELGQNQDFYGNQIWRESDTQDKQLGDIMRHLSKTYLPPLVADQLPGGYTKKGERQWRGIKGSLEASKDNQNRNLMEELLRSVGAKIQPIDADIQETFQNWNQRKSLENMLLERGIIDQFKKPIIPK